MISAGSNYLEPRTTRHESVGSQSSCPHTPVSPQFPFTAGYTYDANSAAATPNSQQTSAPNSPLYINVPDGEEHAKQESPQNSAYLYLTEKYERPYPPPLTLPSPSYELGRDQPSPSNLQYITLELSNNRSSSPSVRTPGSEDAHSLAGYTTIDFQKTWALKQSTKPNVENDRGCTRRTRHNSTLYEVQSAYR